MRSFLFSLFITVSSVSVFSQNQIDATVQLTGDKKDITINTADNYSLLTRSSIYQFGELPATEAAMVIQKMLSRYGNIAINAAANSIIINEEEQKLSNLLIICKQLDSLCGSDFKVRVIERIPMIHTKASDIIEHIASYASLEGRLIADDQYNIITVIDNQYAIDKIKQVVVQYDVPPKQIVIDLEIVEVEKGKLAEKGIDWDKLLSESWVGVSNNFNNLINISDKENRSREIDKSDYLDISSGTSISSLRDIIRVMETKGNARILSTPKLITLSGKHARIWSGKDIVYRNESSDNRFSYRSENKIDSRFNKRDYDTSYHSTSDYLDETVEQTASAGSNFEKQSRYQQFETRTAGLEIGVTPFYSASGQIRLDINCKMTTLMGWTGNQMPIVSGQELNNNIICKSEQTILIGGLKKQNNITRKKRIPVLGVILPFLMSRSYTEEVETEIAIFLTPRIHSSSDISEINMKDKKQ